MLLQELLTIPIYNRAHIMAGHSGLSRTVQSVNIMDAPDIITFLKPGDLLLTNGYFMKDSPDKLIELIRSMDKIGCTGLGVKTKRFALEITEEAFQEAERLQFPIIELSSVDHSLGEIFQQSTSFLLENTNHELHYALTIHKQFSSMIMHGKGIPDIIETLTGLLGSPVLLASLKLQISGQSRHFQSSGMKRTLGCIIDALGTLPAIDSPVSLCLTHPEVSDYRFIQLYPIYTYRHEGYLIALRSSPSDSKMAALALEQAANVIGLEFTKKQAVKERSRRYKNEFFSDLIEGFLTSEQEVVHRGKKYGLKAKGTSLMIVAKKDEWTDSGSTNTVSLQEEKLISERDVHYEWIKRLISQMDIPFVMFTKNDVFGLLLFIRQPDSEESGLIGQLEQVVEQLYRESQLSMSFGVGHRVTGVLDIGLSFKEAHKALQIGYQMKKTRFVRSHQANDFSHLFRMVPLDELKQYYDETFKSLLANDEGEQNELLKTLHAYYENHCQLVETAKQLFVHRNTVIYRLEKCEKLTGRKLKDPTESLRFRIAFAIEQLLNIK
ncbi:PucR family transcriptional regulator [Paenibacillus sp. H1-7]|uniref:PucR family transcriptional regulator n=1 Tax=Paenibacillus sp. H1-7 TaxID=2282849 RepID=UPI001EF822B6|nr:PucR family transcriptional regulator [Paenibacillus sp. H1-7]ULL18471.1 PucR family transcriptional regulator [Paenibacillus sp. H1-7]